MIRKKINDLIARILFSGILLLVAVLAGCKKDDDIPIGGYSLMEWNVVEKSEGIECEYEVWKEYDRVISKVYLTPPGGTLVLQENPGSVIDFDFPYELRDLYQTEEEGGHVTEYSGKYFDFTIERGTILRCIFHDIPGGFTGQVCELELVDVGMLARASLSFEVR